MQASYLIILIDIGIISTGDAICLSWITLKNRDGASDSAWIGDIGKSCGQNWAWGNQEAGYVQDTGERISPSCTLLDADHTNDIASGAMKINFSAYADNLIDAISSGRACSATSFSYGAGEIDGTYSHHSYIVIKLVLIYAQEPPGRSLASHSSHAVPNP